MPEKGTCSDVDPEGRRTAHITFTDSNFDPLARRQKFIYKLKLVHIPTPWNRMRAALKLFAGFEGCSTDMRILEAFDHSAR